MKRLMRAAIALTGLVGLIGPSAAHAQAPFGRPPVNQYTRPPISPYLNLFRGGNPAINYYDLVRPQQDFAAAIQMQQQALFGPQALTGVGAGPGLPPTGHPATFMNFGHYYGTRIAGSANLRPAMVPPAGLPPATLSPLNYPGANVPALPAPPAASMLGF
jgi:hypothetical protein